jgi:hypothetical protein
VVVAAAVFHYNSDGSALILDVSGRKVCGVAAGANDLSRLAPGIYVIVAGRGLPPRKLVKLK